VTIEQVLQSEIDESKKWLKEDRTTALTNEIFKKGLHW